MKETYGQGQTDIIQSAAAAREEGLRTLARIIAKAHLRDMGRGEPSHREARETSEVRGDGEADNNANHRE